MYLAVLSKVEKHCTRTRYHFFFQETLYSGFFRNADYLGKTSWKVEFGYNCVLILDMMYYLITLIKFEQMRDIHYWSKANLARQHFSPVYYVALYFVYNFMC